VLSNVAKMLHVDPLNKHSWFLFAATSYSLNLISAAPTTRAHSSEGVLRHALDLHVEEKARLTQALSLLRKLCKDAGKVAQPGKERDDEAALVHEMHDVETKLFFLRMAISDCCLLQGDEQHVAEALQLAKDASAAASAFFTGTQSQRCVSSVVCPSDGPCATWSYCRGR
jgi:hypothetical protein